MEQHYIAIVIGGVFAALTVLLGLTAICLHVAKYIKPHPRKFATCIVLMAPIYALDALFDLCLPHYAIYVDAFREFYKAFVIYNFIIFLLNLSVSSKNPTMDYYPPWPVFRTLTEESILYAGMLLFIVVRPITASVAFICDLFGVYGELEFNRDYAYPYLAAINFIPQFAAMASSFLFSFRTKNVLTSRSMLLNSKDGSINLCPLTFYCNAAIYLSFLQGSIIGILVKYYDNKQAFTTDKTETIIVSSTLQSFFICIEMFVLSLIPVCADIFRFPDKIWSISGYFPIENEDQGAPLYGSIVAQENLGTPTEESQPPDFDPPFNNYVLLDVASAPNGPAICDTSLQLTIIPDHI